jgi:DNA-binding Xre family transcriptional regulator
MITSDRQYDAAKHQLARLAESLAAPTKANVPDIIASVGRGQTEDLVAEIQRSIEEYEQLKNTRLEDIEIHSLEDLITTPIRYRIVARMSVDEFSRKVGVSARQIMRYESEGYQNITSNNLKKILKGLNIRLEGKVA